MRFFEASAQQNALEANPIVTTKLTISPLWSNCSFPYSRLHRRFGLLSDPPSRFVELRATPHRRWRYSAYSAITPPVLESRKEYRTAHQMTH